MKKTKTNHQGYCDCVNVGSHQMTEPELAPPSPSCSTTSARGRLTLDVRFSVHQAHIHDGSSLESGFEPGALPPQSRDLTTRPLPRIPLMTIRVIL
ncbi:hypothetical protein AVEN_251905-1 [Araneus ventricosus]|uniref:Uncharacterized protein n=1 Tax=Araneus ventricosus TaxID=182803 RepID=A0A4Y2VDE1_ARAVE|nr:hypothetical protein AVEN_251905-1 [Araneus ventricosus]